MAAIADAQRGRISREQLLAAGLTPSMIKTRLRSGRLRPRHRGVYAVGHAVPIEFGEETAAVLACGQAAVLTHDTAVWVWRMVPSPPDEVNVTLIDRGYIKSRPGIRAHHSLTLTAKDVVIHKGLPVTIPARALLDFAEDSPVRELESALDEGLALKIVTRPQIEAVLDRAGAGRHGAPLVHTLLDPRRPSSIERSKGEKKLRALILSTTLPKPHMQARLHGFTADFYWPEADYAVEFDGYQFHSTLSAFKRDRAKNRAFAKHGILLDRFTWEDITTGAIATIAHIASTIAERTAARRSAA